MQAKSHSNKKTWPSLIYFLNSRPATFASIFLSFFLILGIVVMGFPEVLEAFGLALFNKNSLILISILGYVCFSYTFCFWLQKPLWQKVFIWIQTNILFLVSLFYFSRLSLESDYYLLGFYLQNRVSSVFLVSLNFLVNLNLFGKYKDNLGLTLSQVFLLALQCYSLVRILNLASLYKKEFGFEWLQTIFSLNPIFWIVIFSVCITLVSVTTVATKKVLHKIYLSIVFFWLIFQTMLILYFAKVSYWYHTLSFLIVWDFIHIWFIRILQQKPDFKVLPKFIVSFIYHFALIFMVFLSLYF